MKKIRLRKGVYIIGSAVLILLILKLTKVIKWSWIWVLTPLWIPITLFILSVVVIFIVYKVTKKNIVTYNNKF